MEFFWELGAWGRRLFALLILSVVFAAFAWRKHTQHPLYKFPGPFIASISNLHHTYWLMSLRQPWKLLKLHEKYGSVVRVAPNELSFNTASSWRDIYGFRHGHKTFIKSAFYEGGAFADQGVYSIVSERDPVEHGHMRKYLSHSFSDKSLKEQEPLIDEIIDEFVKQVGVYGAKRGGCDLVTWFNLATFDIIGSLAFGETFGGVKSGGYHFWIKLVFKAMSQATLADTFSRYPLAGKLLAMMAPKKIAALVEGTKKHENHVKSLIEKRMQNTDPRPDFLTPMIADKSIQHNALQISAHSSDFVIAGSETTATTLSCVAHYVLKNKHVYQKLTQEIRSTFDRYEGINATSSSQLKYLHAVVLEGLRIYAPLPLGLPRVVPQGGDSVDGQFLPGGVIVNTNPYAASLSSSNFEQPLEFKPERWLGVNEKDILEATQPFSLGPRGCLGRNLAWIELSLILSKLFWTYDLELLNKNVDWHRDSRMSILWQKPALHVAVRPAQKT